MTINVTTMRDLMKIVEGADFTVSLYETAYPFRPAIVNLTTENTGGTENDNTIRATLRDLLRKHAGNYVNVEAGIQITLTNAGIDRSLRVSGIELRAHFALIKILEQGVLLPDEPPSHKRPDMVKMWNLGASLNFNDQLFHFVAKIREFKGDKKNHYAMFFEDLEQWKGEVR